MDPVQFYAPLSKAQDGCVDDPNLNAFNGTFVNPKKQKFSARLLVSTRVIDDATHWISQMAVIACEPA